MASPIADYPLDYTKGPEPTPKHVLEDAGKAAAERISSAAAGVQSTVEGVADQVRDYGDKVKSATTDLIPSIEKQIKEQPIAMMAAVIAIGFVAGALWKR